VLGTSNFPEKVTLTEQLAKQRTERASVGDKPEVRDATRRAAAGGTRREAARNLGTAACLEARHLPPTIWGVSSKPNAI